MLINNRCVVSVKFSIFNLFILLDTNIYHSTIKSTACSCHSCPGQSQTVITTISLPRKLFFVQCLLFSLCKVLCLILLKKYFCAIYNLYIFIPDMDNTCRNYFNPSIQIHVLALGEGCNRVDKVHRLDNIMLLSLILLYEVLTCWPSQEPDK